MNGYIEWNFISQHSDENAESGEKKPLLRNNVILGIVSIIFRSERGTRFVEYNIIIKFYRDIKTKYGTVHENKKKILIVPARRSVYIVCTQGDCIIAHISRYLQRN